MNTMAVAGRWPGGGCSVQEVQVDVNGQPRQHHRGSKVYLREISLGGKVNTKMRTVLERLR